LKKLFFGIILLVFGCSYAQTTDLAVTVEAQDLSGNDVSQVHIYEEFQYLITISNSGNTVSDATFTQIINQFTTVISYTSLNTTGGASDVSNFDLNTDNELTGTLASLPSSSSVQI
jgi:hypothetical protein